MAKIGLIAMSAKPYHAGHDGLVRLAAGECDEVHLYVSLSDRARPGEIPILGSDMDKIWKSYIEPSLPGNVKVTYGGSPIGNIWKELGEASKAGSPNTYVLYADPEDLQVNFPDANRMKYAETLEKNGQLELRPVQRTETVDVSGTKMRQYLEKGDAKSFIKNLPSSVDGQAVWDILSATAKNPPQVKATAKAKTAAKPAKKAVKGEALLRSFIRGVLRG